MFVCVLDQNNNPLMPTTPSRARRWIVSGKATPFFKKGIFCVRLNQEPNDNQKQEIAVGVDPGSKKEGFCVLSQDHQYLNIQADALTWVKDKIELYLAASEGFDESCEPTRLIFRVLPNDCLPAKFNPERASARNGFSFCMAGVAR